MMAGLISALLWVTGAVGGMAVMHMLWFVFFCPPELDDHTMRFRHFVTLWLITALVTCLLFNFSLERFSLAR